MSATPGTTENGPHGPRSVSGLPLGTRVQFDPATAPGAARRHKDRTGTVVTHNRSDGEVGIAFGWAAKRPDGPGWLWADTLVWAQPRELTIRR